VDLTTLDPEVRELLPLFVQGSRGRLESLDSLLQAQRFDDIRRLGHGLKGTSSMYQLDWLAELGKALEQAAEQGDLQAITECGREWRRSLDELAALL
jgi:HPt (histidine-containing phosphotransfer) domain-containing protein